MRALLKNSLNAFNRSSGYTINVAKSIVKPDRTGVNLNVGAGSTSFFGFTNLDYASDWYDKKKRQSFIHYDIRSEALPFEDGSVDTIYCSHVIEHIEEEFVRRFIREAQRCLRSGGALRLVCPDAEFLWSVSQFENRYWRWLHNHYAMTSTLEDVSALTSADCLIHVLATRRCRFFGHTTDLEVTDTPVDPADIDFSKPYQDQFDALTEPLAFDDRFVHTHISWWDFQKLQDAARAAGFRHIVRSKFQGSVAAQLIGVDLDRTHPEMSLYVDCIK